MELCSSQVIYILNKQNLQLVGQRRSLVFSCQTYQQQQNCACLQVQSPYKNRWHSGFCLQKAKFTVSWSNKITRFLCQTYQLQQKCACLQVQSPDKNRWCSGQIIYVLSKQNLQMLVNQLFVPNVSAVAKMCLQTSHDTYKVQPLQGLLCQFLYFLRNAGTLLNIFFFLFGNLIFTQHPSF